jgi:hypothetical protein
MVMPEERRSENRQVAKDCYTAEIRLVGVPVHEVKCKRQFNSTRPALMGFSVILKNNPQKSKNDSSQKI